MKNPFLQLFLPVIIVAMAVPVFPWTGKVVSITDGDTLTVLRDGREQVKIRLYGVDAPELSQDFGSRARQALSSLAYGRQVEVLEPTAHDRYGRTVARVLSGGQDVGREVVAQGLAWVYPQYCTKQPLCTEWSNLEKQARSAKFGLWSVPGPVPPWEWRHPEKSESGKQQVAAATTFHGNVKSGIFHRPGCRHYYCKACTATFLTRDAATKAGYRPCKVCRP